MNRTFHRLMRQATRLTTAGNLRVATAAIQRALAGGLATTFSAPTATPTPSPKHSFKPASAPASTPRPRQAPAPPQGDATVLEGYVQESPATKEMPQPLGQGESISGSHKHAGLTRAYRLYLPPGAADRPMPMVVMLHGCKQNPDDFAAGTGMNALAQEFGVIVLYPEQAQDANPARCWNWFKHNHQGRGSGEAALIASMTQAVLATHGADPARVYIAGLSAGGAMATLVAAAHPEIFAAVGVHSGLAPGAARNLPQGLAAMRSGASEPMGAGLSPRATLPVPTIVFHGDKDTTVHHKNGDQITAAALAGSAQRRSQGGLDSTSEKVVTASGRRYTRTIYGTAPVVAEHWLLHGAGHAWSGGKAAGSYTDPAGPDASREMLRFFMSQSDVTGR